jgi:hypothetical protein
LGFYQFNNNNILNEAVLDESGFFSWKLNKRDGFKIDRKFILLSYKFASNTKRPLLLIQCQWLTIWGGFALG